MQWLKTNLELDLMANTLADCISSTDKRKIQFAPARCLSAALTSLITVDIVCLAVAKRHKVLTLKYVSYDSYSFILAISLFNSCETLLFNLV